MYIPKLIGQFKKDFKLCIKRDYNMELIETAMRILCGTGTLPLKYLPHPLYGKYKGKWEAHLAPDWLLEWYKDETARIIYFVRTGTHTDLFK
ncbi:addiction module toxin, RelE/StbE family [Bacteroidia bacterium]|nr:addiction module toxin, RelE/StbE family [Bacteroidia bacterium]